MKKLILREKKDQEPVLPKTFPELTIKKFTLKTGVKAGREDDNRTSCGNAYGGETKFRY